MSSSDLRYPAGGNTASSPPVVTPHYGTSLPNPPGDIASARRTKCATGVRFITTIHGILNIVIIVALVCVIISAGVANREDGKIADTIAGSGVVSTAKVSADHTRNAVLVFAVFTLVLIIIDTVLYITGIINRLPAIFDLIFTIVMLVLAGIFLILGCCAAAWEQRMRDTVGAISPYTYRRKGAAASAAFFLFVSMIAIIVNFVLRLISSPPQRDSQ